MFGSGSRPPGNGAAGVVRAFGFSYIIVGLLIIWGLTGFYQNDAAERSVITRFGKYVGTTTAGLNWRLPWPIDSRTVELATAAAIYQDPRHAYTKALLSAIPSHDPQVKRKKILLEGDVPSPIDPPPGSAFGHRMNHPRYPETIGADLSLKEISPNHWVAADPCCVSEEDWQKLRPAKHGPQDLSRP